MFFYSFNDTASTDVVPSVHTLCLHDALPICDHDGLVEQDRVSLNRVEQLLVRQAGVVETELIEGRTLLAQDVPGRDTHSFEKLSQQRARRRSLEVLDDMRLDPGIADHGQRDRKSTRLNSSH